MKFKTNHSPGPLEIHFEDGDWFILDANGRIIAETWGADNEDMSEANRNLFYAAPAMLEYMMDRAKAIHDMLLWQPNWEGKPVPWQRLELDKIMAILKDAGVDVVEK